MYKNKYIIEPGWGFLVWVKTGGIQMARTGRPKADKPFDHKVTVKFKEEEYQIMVEYAETHNLSISQLII